MKRMKFPPSVSDTPHTAGEQPWQDRYTLLSFGISLLLAVLITYLVEKPAARLLDEWRARRKTSRQPDSGVSPEPAAAETEQRQP